MYQSYKPNPYSSYDNAPWDQGYPGYRSPPPYDAGSPPISDDGGAEDPEYDPLYPGKPAWSTTARHPSHGSFALVRPGRAAQYPGSDGGWRQTPGLASGLGWDSRCPECGRTKPTTDEWGRDDGDGPSSYYYANVTGHPYYDSTPTPRTHQQSRYSRYSLCPFCGQTWSTTTTTTTAHAQQPAAGTGQALALALAPAQADDDFYGTGAYYGSSFPGHFSREGWHSGSPAPFNNASIPYQGPYSSMGTGPYDHYWPQRHQGSYSPSPYGAPYDFQSPPYYPTTDPYDRANQGIPAGGYPYGIPGMGTSGAPRRRVRASYQYSSVYITRSAGGMGMGSSPYVSEYD